MHEGITFNGRHSYRDLGITIADFSPGMPEPVELRETVPYMDGDYDFSQLGGKPAYGSRTITVIFNLIGKDYNDLYHKRTEVVNWLCEARGGSLTFDGIEGKQFENVSAKIPADGFSRVGYSCAELTVTFTAAPYMTEGTYNKVIMSLPKSELGKCGYIYTDILGNATAVNISGTADKSFTSAEITSGVYQYDCTDISDEMLVAVSAVSNVGNLTVAGSEQSVLSPEHYCSDGDGVLYIYRFKMSEHPGATAIRATVGSGVISAIGGYNITRYDNYLPIDKPVDCKSGFISVPYTINGLTADKLSVGANVIRCESAADLVFVLPKEVL